jgi:hypothetical protein
LLASPSHLTAQLNQKGRLDFKMFPGFSNMFVIFGGKSHEEYFLVNNATKMFRCSRQQQLHAA